MIYCISDIHGEYELFMRLMDKIGINKSDTLVVLGDIIDKGRDSVRLLKILLPNKNCRIILGNHEYDFLKSYHGLMMQADEICDYDEFLKSLQQHFPFDGNLLTWELIDMLDCLPSYVEFENFIGVHAGIAIDNFGKINMRCTTEQFVYDRNFKNPNVVPQEAKCIIFGHTPTRYITGEDKFIFYKRHQTSTDNYISEQTKISDFYKIHIDTGVYLSGVLGCLRVDDCKEFYVRKN